MSKSYRLTACFLSLVVLTACESQEAKLQRLNGERAVQCLLVDKYAEDLEAARKWNRSQKIARSDHADSLLSDWTEADTKCTLATRDLERFMR